MKRGKTVTFQLQDSFEKDLHEYCEELHNFSGTIKRILGGSQGFKEWQEKKKRRNVTVVGSSQNSGVVKFSL